MQGGMVAPTARVAMRTLTLLVGADADVDISGRQFAEIFVFGQQVSGQRCLTTRPLDDENGRDVRKDAITRAWPPPPKIYVLGIGLARHDIGHQETVALSRQRGLDVERGR